MDAKTRTLLANMAAMLTAALDESAPAKPKASAKAPKAKAAAPREVSAAAAHCRDARLARREANPLTAHGLTKAEKSYLYHTYEDYSGAVIAYKALPAKKQAKVIAGELDLCF